MRLENSEIKQTTIFTSRNVTHKDMYGYLYLSEDIIAKQRLKDNASCLQKGKRKGGVAALVECVFIAPSTPQKGSSKAASAASGRPCQA